MISNLYKTIAESLQRRPIANGLLSGFVLCLVAVVSQPRPPAAMPPNASEVEFSSGRAMGYLRRIAQTPRPIGSTSHSEARNFLVEILSGLELDPEIQTATAVSHSSTLFPPYRAGLARNVIARLRSEEAGAAILLVAHYDTVPTSPGASDDGSGVATLLETARALKAGPPLKNDVIFLFTDGEEVGSLGAQAFVDEHPWAKDVKVVLNFESRGSGGPSVMFETSENNGRLIKMLSENAALSVANSLSSDIYKRMPNDTDFSVFKRAGFKGLNFAYLDGIHRYHTARDSVKYVDEGSIQHHGSYALAMSRYLGDLRIDSEPAPNAIYFDIMGRLLIHYPGSLALPLMIVSLIGFTLVIGAGCRRRILTAKEIAMGAAALTVIAGAVWGTLSLVWEGIKYLQVGYDRLPWGEPYNTTVYYLSFILLTVAVTFIVYAWFGSRANSMSLSVGAMFWWAALAGVVTVLVPGGSYLFTWPLLFMVAGAAAFITWGEKRPVIKSVIPLLCSIPGLLLMTPLINLLLSALTMSAAPVIMVLIALCLGVVVPHFSLGSGKWRPVFLTAVLLLGLGFAFLGLLTSGFNPNHPKLNSVFYGLNVDTGKAVWSSLDAEPDEWTSQFFIKPAPRGKMGDFFPLETRSFLSSEAPSSSFPAPEVSALSDDTKEGVRTLQLRIVSLRKAPIVSIYLEDKSQILEASVKGKRLLDRKTGDGQSGLWGMHFYALPEEGITLTLKTFPSRPIQTRVVDRSYGLPEHLAVTFSPRPDYMMPIASAYSEATLVGKSFTIN